MEKVSWGDARRFCARLNGLLAGQMPSGHEFCLPTEAQWEYACRAGESGPYSGGAPDDVAWHEGNSGSFFGSRKTHPVGRKLANAWGFHDMHGNVEEWCQDRYGKDYYGTDGAATDPQGLASGGRRVVRGGSWGNWSGCCTSSYRSYLSPGYRDHSVGFRVCWCPCK